VTGEIVVPDPVAEVVAASDVPALTDQIRPQWQAKGLIERVRRLLRVDPSSACQRLLNAAVADLREKVKIAGLDIAKDAAAVASGACASLAARVYPSGDQLPGRRLSRRRLARLARPRHRRDANPQ
jgi:hypothetical protein